MKAPALELEVAWHILREALSMLSHQALPEERTCMPSLSDTTYEHTAGGLGLQCVTEEVADILLIVARAWQFNPFVEDDDRLAINFQSFTLTRTARSPPLQRRPEIRNCPKGGVQAQLEPVANVSCRESGCIVEQSLAHLNRHPQHV